MMMAPAPMMMAAPQTTIIQTGMQQPAAQEKEWKEPSFNEVKNSVPCCARLTGPCSYKFRTFQQMQVRCDFPSCQYDACTRCEAEERYCEEMMGPRIFTGCGRNICAHHAKWYAMERVGRETIICNSDECDKTRKTQMCYYQGLLRLGCPCLSCPIVCCCPGQLEVGQRYRGKNGEELVKNWQKWVSYLPFYLVK